MEKDRKFKLPTIKIPGSFWVWMFLVLLLTPAIIFWLSVLMYVGLGTDYVFDVVLEQLYGTPWGNTLVIFLVVGCPALVIAISGMEYVKTKNKRMILGLVLGAAFLMLGFFTILKKI